MRLSPSALLRFQTCPRQYYFYYIERLRSRETPVQLLLGRVLHQAIAGYHRAQYAGNAFDIAREFERLFRVELRRTAVKETPRWDCDAALATGRRLADQFPDAWAQTGLIPLVDHNGPIIERSMTAPIPRTLHTLVGIMDILAMDYEGLVYLLDYKTTASPSDQAVPLSGNGQSMPFAACSSQLTAYQALAQNNIKALGLDRIDRIGFMEMIKRKASGAKGPQINPPQIVAPRNAAALADFMQSAKFVADTIASQRFPKFTGAHYNTPCRMCEFAQLCFQGQDTHLAHADALKNEQDDDEIVFEF